MKMYDLYRTEDGDLFVLAYSGDTLKRKWVKSNGQTCLSLHSRVGFDTSMDDEVMSCSDLIKAQVPEDKVLILAEYL